MRQYGLNYLKYSSNYNKFYFEFYKQNADQFYVQKAVALNKNKTLQIFEIVLSLTFISASKSVKADFYEREIKEIKLL